MKTKNLNINREWYKATLTPVAMALFTDSFYPNKKKNGDLQHVYFTQVDSTPTMKKVIVASKMSISSLRILTLDLALASLKPGNKATKTEMAQLNELSKDLKL